MLAIETDDTGIVMIKASGRLSKADYDRFVPAFGARWLGPILIELHDFHGWDLSGLQQELKFDTTHQNNMGRVAVVGERTWQGWGTRLSKPFFKAEIQYFEHAGAADARAWLHGQPR